MVVESLLDMIIGQKNMIDCMDWGYCWFSRQVDGRMMSNDVVCIDLLLLVLCTYRMVWVERSDTIVRAAGCDQSVESIPVLYCCKRQV